MDGSVWFLIIVAIISGVFSAASSSIGIQCFNENPNTKEKYGQNYNYLIANLVLAVFAIVVACIIISLGLSWAKKQGVLPSYTPRL